jgi:hypothetical protein
VLAQTGLFIQPTPTHENADFMIQLCRYVLPDWEADCPMSLSLIANGIVAETQIHSNTSDVRTSKNMLFIKVPRC